MLEAEMYTYTSTYKVGLCRRRQLFLCSLPKHLQSRPLFAQFLHQVPELQLFIITSYPCCVLKDNPQAPGL